MSNMILGRENWIDSGTAQSAVTVSATSAQTSWPAANVRLATNGELSNPHKFRKTGARYGGYALYLGESRSVRAVSLHALLQSTVRGRLRIQASDTDDLANPDLRLDFLGGYTQGLTYPNDLDPLITFSRASGGMCWRGGDLFGCEFVTTSAIAATTAQTEWTVRTGGKWQTGDLVYVLPEDGTANISLTATVSNYAGDTLTLTSITAGSDTTTTKTAWKIVYRGPRLDSHPLTRRRRGLLIEGAGTNLRTYSQQFTNAAYAESGSVSFDGMGTAPDGSTTAAKLVEDGGNGAHEQYDDVTIAADTVYSVSRWFKPAGRHQVRLQWSDTTGADAVSAVFNLRTGARPTASTSGSASNANAFVTRGPNGWVRCTVVGKINNSSTTGRTDVALYDGSSTSYVGVPGLGVYEWQAQVEASSFPTSDIPTVGASASRSADVASITGSSFTGFFKQGAGTVLAAVAPLATISGNLAFWQIDDGTSSNRLFAFSASTSFRAYSIVGGVVRGASETTVEINYGRHRTAFAWAGGDYGARADGYTSSTDTIGALPVGLARMTIGTGAGAEGWHGHIEDLAYLSRRLPNARLEAWSNRGATINHDYTGCTVSLPHEVTHSRASGASYIDSTGRVQGFWPTVSQPIVPQTTREERARNGGFDSDSLWTKGTGWSIGSGVATKSAGTGSSLTQTIPTVPGQIYRLRATVTRSAGTLTVTDGSTTLATLSADGTVSATFTATATTTVVTFTGDASYAGTVDNVSVTLDQGITLDLGAGQDIRVGQLLRITPQDGTANTYMLGTVVSYDRSSGRTVIDVVEAAAPELVSNGHFTSDTTGWTGTDASLSTASGKLRVTASASPGYAYQAESVTSGYTYLLQAEADATAASSAGAVSLRNSADGTGTALASSTVSSGATARVSLQTAATSANLSVRLTTDTNTGAVDFDNISLKRAHTSWVAALAGPRFTYDTARTVVVSASGTSTSDGTGGALGYYPEDAATNLMTVSEDTSTDSASTGWGRNNITRTSAGHSDPFGRRSGTLWTASGGSASHYVQISRGTIASPYDTAASIFVKAGTATKIRLLCRSDTSAHGGYVDFDLTTLTETSTAVGSGAVAVTYIETFPGGWYRLGLMVNHTAAASGHAIIVEAYILDASGASTFTPGSTPESLYTTGLQIEDGACRVPTSYIPTFGVAVTRAADTCTIEGDEFNARIRQDAGTLMVSAKPIAAVNSVGNARWLVSLNDGTANERIAVRFIAASTPAAGLLVRDGGSIQAGINGGTVTDGANLLGTAYAANDFALYLGGSQVGTDTSGTLPTTTKMSIGHDYAGATHAQSTIARLVYLPERESNAGLAAMSTAGGDLDAYTIPGTLADAYGATVDTGWLLNRRSYGTGDLPEGVTEWTRHPFATAQTYRYWRVDMLDPLGPDGEPTEADDGLALQVGYLGLWDGVQFENNPEYGAVQGFRSFTQEQRSLAGAAFVDRRPSVDTWGLSWPVLTQSDSNTLRGVKKFLDRDRPCLIILDPSDDVGFYETDKLGRQTQMGQREWSTFGLFRDSFAVEEIVA